DSEIRPSFLLGPEDYQVDTIGLTNTLDLRESPYVNPRGFLIGNTLDVASSALGSDIEFIAGRWGFGSIFQFGPNRSRRVSLKINPPALLCSVGSDNRQSRSVRVPALFIRSPTAA